MGILDDGAFGAGVFEAGGFDVGGFGSLVALAGRGVPLRGGASFEPSGLLGGSDAAPSPLPRSPRRGRSSNGSRPLGGRFGPEESRLIGDTPLYDAAESVAYGFAVAARATVSDQRPKLIDPGLPGPDADGGSENKRNAPIPNSPTMPTTPAISCPTVKYRTAASTITPIASLAAIRDLWRITSSPLEMQQRLYFFPLPQGQGSFRAIDISPNYSGLPCERLLTVDARLRNVRIPSDPVTKRPVGGLARVVHSYPRPCHDRFRADRHAFYDAEFPTGEIDTIE